MGVRYPGINFKEDAMPRKSKTAIEEGYLRSWWAELDELEREYGYVCVVSIIPTAQRGVFSVQLTASKLTVDVDGQIAHHKVSKRVPSGESLPFTGALWDLSRKLHDMVAEYEIAIAPGGAHED